MASFLTKPESTDASVPAILAFGTKSETAKAGGGEEGDAEGGDGDDDGAVVQEESTATFEALVHLEKIEVKTNEEEEDVVYSQRAKLFAYTEALLDKGTGVKSWCEKGVGDCKFLKHKAHGRVRMLMRVDNTLKIIANHFIDPRIRMQAYPGNDKSLMWITPDFSNGETLEEMTFMIRFKDAELAAKFKSDFAAQQEGNAATMKGADSKEGAAEADELAAATAGLKVEAEKEKEAEAEK